MLRRWHITMLNSSALLLKMFPVLALLACLVCLNGCAALAVSLAGAGASAGLSHQITGTAARTFSEPLEKVDSAAQIAARKMQLVVDEVATKANGQQTLARVGELKITISLEPLTGNLTRVDVEARKDFFRLDYATAQEIVAQVERSLYEMSVAEAEASRRSALNEAKYKTPATPAGTPARKTSTTPRRRDSI
ncbi:MAG: hypothetical protein H6R19_2473 [Proteobacteria bacterium]|nr:hypothetical protein [Pseudomonadota bacterium]